MGSSKPKQQQQQQQRKMPHEPAHNSQHSAVSGSGKRIYLQQRDAQNLSHLSSLSNVLCGLSLYMHGMRSIWILPSTGHQSYMRNHGTRSYVWNVCEVNERTTNIWSTLKCGNMNIWINRFVRRRPFVQRIIVLFNMLGAQQSSAVQSIFEALCKRRHLKNVYQHWMHIKFVCVSVCVSLCVCVCSLVLLLYICYYVERLLHLNLLLTHFKRQRYYCTKYSHICEFTVLMYSIYWLWL